MSRPATPPEAEVAVAELLELRQRHQELVSELLLQKERMSTLVERLRDLCEGIASQRPPHYYLAAEEATPGLAPTTATDTGITPQAEHLLAVAAAMQQRLASVCSPDRAGLSALASSSECLVEEVADLRQRYERQKKEMKKHVRKLARLNMQWKTAALSYSIRPPTSSLPELRPPPPPLDWTGGGRGRRRRLNVVEVGDTSPRAPPGKPPQQRARHTPPPPPAADTAVQGIRLLLSAFCTDLSLLLHRGIEAHHLRSPAALAALQAPPYFPRDKVAHQLLAGPDVSNPFADDVQMLQSLYDTAATTLLCLASPPPEG